MAALHGLILLALQVHERDRDMPRQFQQTHPCPSTGRTSGACPGWQRDYVIAVCRGGPDMVANLQWLTEAAHKLKTRGDCRKLPR